MQQEIFDNVEKYGITHPDVKMALSAMIKCVRMRYFKQASYWLHYMWVMFPDERWRVSRRLLIMAAEDNLSIPTQVSVSMWLRYGARKEAPFRRALMELLRIMKTPNWWEDPDGQEYISMWNDAYKWHKKKPFDGVKYEVLIARLKEKANSGDILEVFAIHAELLNRPDHDKKRYNEDLLAIAYEQENVPAIRMLRMVLRSLRALYGDDNYEGQALWWLCGRTFGHQVDTPTDAAEVKEMEDFIASHWSGPTRLHVPAWCCDGVHTSGKDRRFGGILSSMVGCCRAFNHFGRLDPSDQWKQEFWR